MYTRLQKNGPILLPSVGPCSRTDSDMFTQSGVFFLGMGIAQKRSRLTIYKMKRNKKLRYHKIFLNLFEEAESIRNIFVLYF